ncbi:VrrA/YqfQ family protein [Peribacillus loiseleuriae]|uniref:VrrA/YqfQ family protein n=1 Tax=Peribacillus loiseleuriae TaxID=1679170 RepID=UPI00069FB73A|nr:VrrA/YqfQ family protein [Peribacillus loiseleuriae]
MPPNRMFGQGRGNGNPQSFRGQNGFSGPANFPPPQARNTMRPGAGFGQGQGQGNRSQQQPSSGGLLSKLLGKNKNQSSKNPFAPPSAASQATRGAAAQAGAGGILGTLKNPGALSGMLANTQKVLQAAEQVTPMIQQYSPIVKNIPSMWKIFQALKNSGSADSAEETPKETVENITDPLTENTAVKEEEVQEKKPRKKRTVSGDSSPKLYI